MPEIKRNFFGAYYSADPLNPRMFHGIEVMHATACGLYRDGDKDRALMFYQMCKDALPDTHGKNVEMCDFSSMDADLDNQPIMQALMQDPSRALELVHPVVRELLIQDFQAGKSAFEIAEERAGVLVPEFLGFTLEQVLQYRPDILQPIADEDGNESPNVQRCSLETF